MEKERIPDPLTEEEMIEMFKIRATRLPPPERRELTPEEEEHWAQVRARIAEARKKGEL